VADILIAVTDGLKRMSEALAVVYPLTTLQTCIVHLIRNSLDYAGWKDRKPLAMAIKPNCPEPSAAFDVHHICPSATVRRER
jgi:putative transposase